MCFLIHEYKWAEAVYNRTVGGMVQVGTCQRCGKQKAREVTVNY